MPKVAKKTNCKTMVINKDEEEYQCFCKTLLTSFVCWQTCWVVDMHLSQIGKKVEGAQMTPDVSKSLSDLTIGEMMIPRINCVNGKDTLR